MAQINQFDPQNNISLKVWLKPYFFAMKIGIKLNIFPGK